MVQDEGEHLSFLLGEHGVWSAGVHQGRDEGFGFCKIFCPILCGSFYRTGVVLKS